MDLNRFNLGVGPMSPEIVTLCLEYSHIYSFPLMIIASRNQADYDSGYVCTTSQLSTLIKDSQYYDPERILLCRDHCGPYFSDLDSGLDLEAAMQRCIATIKSDCAAGFDLIHIDVSRIPKVELQKSSAIRLYQVAKECNPKIKFEFGSEQNEIGNVSEIEVRDSLDIAKALLPELKFFVSPTGSLTKHIQVGEFDVDTVKKLVDLVHTEGLLFKEHNADYLSIDEVKLRRAAGIDALNIAPQLGRVQTEVLHDLGHFLGPVYTNFKELALGNGYWGRWVPCTVTDDNTKFFVSGHYHFASNEALQLRNAIGSQFMEHLRISMFATLDCYRLGYHV